MYLSAMLLALATSASGPDAVERIEVQGRAPVHNSTYIQLDGLYQPGMTLAQVLRQVPGLYVRQSGGPGGDFSISLEGSASAQVLVLLDGEPMTSSTLGTPLLQHIDPAEIASIEVIHGGAAAAYGAGAMAGAIHLRTHASGPQVLGLSRMRGSRPHSDAPSADGTHGYLRLSQSVNTQTDAALSLGIRSQDTPLLARTSQPHSDTSYFNPSYDSEHASIEVARQRHGNRTLRVSHRYQASEADYAQQCYDAETFATLPCQPWLKTRQNLTRIEQSRQFSSRTGRLSLSYLSDDARSLDRMTDEANWSGFNERYSTQRWRAAYVNERRMENGVMVTRGAEWQREYAKSNTLQYDQQSRARFALFNQYSAPTGSGLGVRVERMGSGSWVVAADLQQAFELSEQAGAVLKISNGYREPGFNDLYWPGVGNPDLGRERSQSVHYDMQYDYAQGSFGVRPFYQRWRNLIVWAPVEGTLWAPQNVASARSFGTTFSLDHQLTEAWALHASVTWQEPQDNHLNQRLAMRPRRLGQLALNYQFAGWRTELTAHGRSGVVSTAGEPIAGYVSYALSVQWQPTEVLTLSLHGDNLTNHRYAEGSDWFEAGRQLRLAAVWRY